MIKKHVSTLGIAFALAGLGCNQPIEDATAGRPALTAEDQAVVDNMAKNTLAEINLPEGKMTFVEVAPGDVAVLRQVRIGANVTHVEGADQMGSGAAVPGARAGARRLLPCGLPWSVCTQRKRLRPATRRSYRRRSSCSPATSRPRIASSAPTGPRA